MRADRFLSHCRRGLLHDPDTDCTICRACGKGPAVGQSHSFGTVLEGWWDLSLNVRYQLQKPGEAWLRAGCGHLSPPTLSESSYTYQLRSRALECAHSQSPTYPSRRTGRKISLKGRRTLGRALTYPGPLLHSGLLGYSQVFFQAHPDPLVASLAAVQHAPHASWSQGMGPHCHRNTVFTRATSEERLVRSLKLLISSSPRDFLSKALLAL